MFFGNDYEVHGSADDKYLNRPLYAFNLDHPDSDKEILAFLNAQYKQLERDVATITRVDTQTEDLGYFSGFLAPLKRSLMFTPDGGFIREAKKFVRASSNIIKDVINNLGSRFSVTKPAFQIYPKFQMFMDVQANTRSAKEFVSAKTQDVRWLQKQRRRIDDCLIFGESYLEHYWDPHLGPYVNDKDEREKVPLLDGDGKVEKDVNNNPIYLNPRQKIGDYNCRLWDPRYVLTQKADSFECSEWVILCEQVSVDKLRFEHPDYADKIKPVKDNKYFDIHTMSEESCPNSTRLYKLYHRPTPELPRGRVILATPHCVLVNMDYPHETMIEQDLFPVVQLRLEDLPNTERGGRSIVSLGKGLQLHYNNILNSMVRNIMISPIMRVWEGSSIDADQIHHRLPADIALHKGSNPPTVLAPDPIKSATMEFLKYLKDEIMKLANVFPISRGGTMPNVESRIMLDFYKDQELSQSVPMDDKVREDLVYNVRCMIAICADEYKEADKAKRMVRYFGKNKTVIQQEIDIEALKVPYDINIEVVNTFSTSFQGKIQEIGEILRIVPNALTPARVLELLEVGSPEELTDSITASVDLANREIEEIWKGHEVATPKRYTDLLPYYDRYLRELNRPEVRELLPEEFDPSLDSSKLKGKEQAAQRLLEQVNAIEMLIDETMINTELNGIVDPKGVSLYKIEVMSRFPTFPTVFIKEDPGVINPLEIQEQALPSEVPIPDQNVMGGLLPPTQGQPMPPTPQGPAEPPGVE